MSAITKAIGDLQNALSLLDMASFVGNFGVATPSVVIPAATEQTGQKMLAMCANEGQRSIIINNVIPKFEMAAAKALADKPEYDWEIVVSDYQDAVGEIVEEGNVRMHEVCRACEEMVQTFYEQAEDIVRGAAGPIVGFIMAIADMVSDAYEHIEDLNEDLKIKSL